MAPIVTYLLAEQVALAMQHDYTNSILRLSQIKAGLDNNITQLVQLSSSLDPNSPEAKSIETRRQHLAALEKKLDSEITYFKHKLDRVEKLRQWAEQGANKGIAS